MLSAALASSISGLRAAETRLAVSADNIANFQTTTATTENGELVNQPYTPKRVEQTSTEPAGTKPSVSLLDPASIPFFDPSSPVADENGIVQTPNVDFVEETANQLLAKQAFQANISMIQRSQETFDEVLNIIS